MEGKPCAIYNSLHACDRQWASNTEQSLNHIHKKIWAANILVEDEKHKQIPDIQNPSKWVPKHSSFDWCWYMIKFWAHLHQSGKKERERKVCVYFS